MLSTNRSNNKIISFVFIAVTLPTIVAPSLARAAPASDAAPPLTPATSIGPDGGVDAAPPSTAAEYATPDAGAPDATPPPPPPVVVAVPPGSPLPVGVPSVNSLSAVVVTAQKRVQKLQDVPIAITVVNGDNLAHNPAIKTAQDIIQYIPNASASSADGRTRPRWFLRGIGTNETAASTVSPIGIYSDDVFLNNVYLQAFPLFDLERVEVLRGPQGTLWGKNTTGGAIHFLSKRPTFDTDGYARGSYGTYNEQSYQGGLGGPIVKDILAARLSFFTEKRDGWIFNEATGRDFGALSDTAARAQLLFSPSANFEALLITKIRRLDAEKNARFYVVNPEKPEDLKNPIYLGPQRGREAISQAGLSQDLFNEDGVTLKLNYFFGRYTLTSISAYERGRRTDVGGSQIVLDIARSRAFTLSRQASQELRLTSPGNQRITWIAGVHYFYESLLNSTADVQYAVPGASATSASPTATSRALFGISDYDQTTKSFAPFASVTAKLLDRLSLTGGLRWSTETKDFDLLRLEAPTGFQYNANESQWWLPGAVNSLKAPLASTQSHTWQELTYDATLQYKVNVNINTYFRYAHGFRAGGYVVAADYTATQLDPETLNAAELGVKTQWQGGRLTFNTAIFNYDYKDIIVGVLLPIPGTTMTRQVQENAAEGYSRGAEFEVGWLPFAGLRVQGAVGLLATKYTSYASSASGESINATGNRFTRAPWFSSAVDIEYSVQLTEGNSVGVGTDWSFRTRQYFNAVNQHDPSLSQASYALGNGRVFYRAGRGKFELSGYVRNVSDSLYSILNTGPSNGRTSLVYGLPRTFGIAAYVRF